MIKIYKKKQKKEVYWFGYKLTKRNSFIVFLLGLFGTLIFATSLISLMLSATYFWFFASEEHVLIMSAFYGNMGSFLITFLILSIGLILSVYSMRRAREVQ